MSFKKVEHKLINIEVSSSILHTNLSEKSDILLQMDNINISDDQSFNDVIEIIKKSVDNKLGYKEASQDSRGINISYLKRQILLLEKFLTVIERYLDLNNPETVDNELVRKIDQVINDITNSFDSEEILKMVNKDFKENQIMNSLTSLMSVQIKLAEKLNKLNI
jgi:hypothetical protein